jgi:hypothetical protein
MSAGEREQEAERHSATKHVYEVRPRKDHRGVDLISDVLPFGRLWYDGPNVVTNEIGYAEQHSRSDDVVIRAYVKESIRRSVRRRAAVHLPNR